MVKFRYPCFSEIDIFGIPPLFTIRGRATFQSQININMYNNNRNIYILFFKSND